MKLNRLFKFSLLVLLTVACNKKESENTIMGNSFAEDTNLIIAGTKLLGDLVTDNNIYIEGEIHGNICVNVLVQHCAVQEYSTVQEEGLSRTNPL